jgi:hypothetical protein
MNRPRLFRILSLLGVFVLSSCSNEKVPKDILDKTAFAKTYSALGEASKNFEEDGGSNLRRFSPDSTLNRFGVSREGFERTIDYYNQDLHRWGELYAEVVKQLQSPPRKKP